MQINYYKDRIIRIISDFTDSCCPASVDLIWLAHRYRYLSGMWKSELGIFNKSLIHENDTVIDIGANKGVYSYWLSKSVGHNGLVIAFEPFVGHVERFVTSMAQLHIKQVRVENMALSNFIGRSQISIPTENSVPLKECGTLNTINRTHLSFDVKVITLDDYFVRYPIYNRRISFIKCDVEGHEICVFEGARKTIEHHKPAIFFECEQRHLSFPMKKVFSLLEEYGYAGFFYENNRKRSIKEFDIEKYQVIDPVTGFPGSPYINNFLFEA